MATFADMDAIRARLADLPGPDADARAAADAREGQLTKPAGSLGRLEEIAGFVATWQAKHPPACDNMLTLVFAGNHGVAARGVSAYPSEVTVQMVANFEAGGAAVNQLCRSVGADFRVLPLDLETPTDDFTRGPAMDEPAFCAAFSTGFDAVPDGLDMLCVGEMGIGNTTSAAALALGLFGGGAEDWTGPGTGVAGDALTQKQTTVDLACAANAFSVDALDTLRCLGGRELAAIAGAVLAARLKQVPVLLDGYVATAAAAPLHMQVAGALDHCLAGHRSTEPGHDRLLNALGKAPLLDLGLRLGEASGAVLALSIVKAACACHRGMATFAEAGVATKS